MNLTNQIIINQKQLNNNINQTFKEESLYDQNCTNLRAVMTESFYVCVTKKISTYLLTSFFNQ